MVKNVKSTRAIYIATACMVVAIFFLWSMVIQSVSIPFLYREKWSAYIALAYVQLSLLSTYMLMRVVPSEFWSKHPDRDRWGAAGGAVIGPLLISYILVLLFPLVANNLTGDVAREEFTYFTTEPYARTSRGLVRLTLLDGKGGEHLVVFKKERVEKLAMKCGDTLLTVGRNSFLGYVIDSEAKGSDTGKQCRQG